MRRRKKGGNEQKGSKMRKQRERKRAEGIQDEEEEGKIQEEEKLDSMENRMKELHNGKPTLRYICYGLMFLFGSIVSCRREIQ